MTHCQDVDPSKIYGWQTKCEDRQPFEAHQDRRTPWKIGRALRCLTGPPAIVLPGKTGMASIMSIYQRSWVLTCCEVFISEHFLMTVDTVHLFVMRNLEMRRWQSQLSRIWTCEPRWPAPGMFHWSLLNSRCTKSLLNGETLIHEFTTTSSTFYEKVLLRDT